MFRKCLFKIINGHKYDFQNELHRVKLLKEQESRPEKKLEYDLQIKHLERKV